MVWILLSVRKDNTFIVIMQEWVYKSFRHVVVVLIDDWGGGLESASAQFRGRASLILNFEF